MTNLVSMKDMRLCGDRNNSLNSLYQFNPFFLEKNIEKVPSFVVTFYDGAFYVVVFVDLCICFSFMKMILTVFL